MVYLLKNKLLSNRQYGFIKGRSTLLQLLNMLDKWTHDLESGGQIDAIYTDFEKAFDKVPHKRLLNKIRSYGFPRELTNWIEAFLLGRKYRVRVNGKFSDRYSVISGIQQGSVLGPLLFILLILMILQTRIQVITGKTYICLLMMQKHAEIYYMYRRLSELAGNNGYVALPSAHGALQICL